MRTLDAVDVPWFERYLASESTAKTAVTNASAPDEAKMSTYKRLLWIINAALWTFNAICAMHIDALQICKTPLQTCKLLLCTINEALHVFKKELTTCMAPSSMCKTILQVCKM
jgi:hypothetical protein